MNVMPQNRIMHQMPRRSLLGYIVDAAGYEFLAIVSLWASVRFSDWSEQFIALAIILGWKWICGNQPNVVQIINYGRGEQ